MVKMGDTFASISQLFYKDSRYADTIARYCGYGSVANNPQPQDTLNLPNLIPYGNKLSEVKSYNDLIDSLIGSLYPAFATPQPKQQQEHHSFWRSLVETLVSAVVAFLMPDLLPVLFPLLNAGTFIANAVVMRVTAALSSAAQQGAAEALHDQDKFEWSALLEQTAVAIATSGFSKIDLSKMSTAEALKTFGERFLENSASLPSYGSGNATPTSKQAPVNTATTSGGQYVNNNNQGYVLTGVQPDGSRLYVNQQTDNSFILLKWSNKSRHKS